MCANDDVVCAIQTLVGMEYLGAALMLIAVIVELAPGWCSSEERDIEVNVSGEGESGGSAGSGVGVDMLTTESSPLLGVHESRRAGI